MASPKSKTIVGKPRGAAPPKPAGPAHTAGRVRAQAQRLSNTAEATRRAKAANQPKTTGGGGGGIINFGKNVKPQAPGIYIGPKKP